MPSTLSVAARDTSSLSDLAGGDGPMGEGGVPEAKSEAEAGGWGEGEVRAASRLLEGVEAEPPPLPSSSSPPPSARYGNLAWGGGRCVGLGVGVGVCGRGWGR